MAKIGKIKEVVLEGDRIFDSPNFGLEWTIQMSGRSLEYPLLQIFLIVGSILLSVSVFFDKSGLQVHRSWYFLGQSNSVLTLDS